MANQINASEKQGLNQFFPQTLTGKKSGERLEGKIAIVTGGNSIMGIGRATAHLFVQNGVGAVFVCDNEDSNFEMLGEELRRMMVMMGTGTGTKMGSEMGIHMRKLDAASAEDVKAVVDEAMSLYGRLDIFFANAGIMGINQKSFENIGPGQFLKTLEVNVLSVFLAIKYASKAMQKVVPESGKTKSGGSIIATASIHGIRAGGPADYSASKAAVINLVKTTAWQLAGTDIRCNAVCPGLIETGMTKNVYDYARERGTLDKIGQINPLKRGGAADEVARVVLFLASDECSYVTAQSWAIDGGLSGSNPTLGTARGKL